LAANRGPQFAIEALLHSFTWKELALWWHGKMVVCEIEFLFRLVGRHRIVCDTRYDISDWDAEDGVKIVDG
jgi:hypothetical protein